MSYMTKFGLSLKADASEMFDSKDGQGWMSSISELITQRIKPLLRIFEEQTSLFPLS